MLKYRSDLSAFLIWAFQIVLFAAVMTVIAFIAASALTLAGLPS